MLCVVIKGPTIQEAHRQIAEALSFADLLELRLDCFTEIDLSALKNLRSYFSIPMIFTLRSPLQGGSYLHSEEERLATIRRLTTLSPEYLDLENSVDPLFIEEISTHYPEIKLILSYHNFVETPPDLEGLYQEMKKTPAFFYKIAVSAHSCLDALRVVLWAKKSAGRLIAISMGSHGEISRILGPVIGSPITYASLDESEKTAPGQVSAKILIERYHHRSLNPSTLLYGLIGDPVDKSISDKTHNSLLRPLAVYIKIQVRPSELSAFLHYAGQVPFHGLSVTMPLKEHILPFLDEIDKEAQEIGAVNTLLFEKGKIHGFNTDGIGALNNLEANGKRFVIIGAGGAARAIAYEAVRRGGQVTLLNRDAEKASQLAASLGCIGKGLEHMSTCAEEGYDILINATPISPSIASDYILPQAIVMETVIKPKETEFLKRAREKGCQIIYGYQMFVEQAVGQFNIWFKERIPVQTSREILKKSALASYE